MSTTVTLQPNASSATNWSNVGGGSLHGALADSTDTTYLTNALGGSTNALTLSFTNPTIPATARIVEVAISARARQPSGANDLRGALRLNGASASGSSSAPVTSSSFAAVTVVARSSPLGSSRWTDAELDGLGVLLWAGLSGGLQVADVDALVRYESEPTIVVGTVTPSAKPTINWVFTDPDRGVVTPQRSDVIVVRAGVTDGSGIAAGSTGFDPEAAPQVDNSGGLLLNGSSYQVGSALGGGTYYAYVRGAKVWTLDSDTWWSPWAASEAFTLIDAAPPPPQIIAATPTADGAVEIRFRNIGNAVGFDRARQGRIAPLANTNNALTGNFQVDPLVGERHGFFGRENSGTVTVLCDEVFVIDTEWLEGERVVVSAWVKAAAGVAEPIYTGIRFLVLDAVTDVTLAISDEFGTVAVTNEYRQMAASLLLPANNATSDFRKLRLEIDAFELQDAERIYVDAYCIRLSDNDAAYVPGVPDFSDRFATVQLQRSDDGTRWTTMPETKTLFFDNRFNTFTDYGTPARGSAQYRVRSVPSPAFSAAGSVASDWSSPFVLAANGSLDRWDLWDPSDNTRIVLHARDHQVSSEDRSATFETVEPDRAAIVHTQTGRGESGRLTLRTYSANEHIELIAMLRSGRTLRLRNHLGDAWWIRISSPPTRRQVRAKADTTSFSTAHIYDVVVGWREVPAPS